MKPAAAAALADLISSEEPDEEYIIPNLLDSRVAPTVAQTVSKVTK